MLNTSYYWEGFLGGWNMLVLLFYVVIFLVLFITLLYQVYLIVKERVKNKQRLYLVFTIISLLSLSAYKPYGIINYEQFEGNDLVIASNEGAANCTTTFKMKENNKFSIRDVCFGIDKITGTYQVYKDTIKLAARFNNSKYKFGIIKKVRTPDNYIFTDLSLYKSPQDTTPIHVTVTKNLLFKL
jgi:hypothetical protein